MNVKIEEKLYKVKTLIEDTTQKYTRITTNGDIIVSLDGATIKLKEKGCRIA